MSLYSQSGLELYLVLTWLRDDLLQYMFVLCQLNKGICSKISGNEIWQHLFEIRFRNTAAFSLLMAYNSYFDKCMGHEWKDAYKIVCINVIRDRTWLPSERWKKKSLECTKIDIDYIDESQLCRGNIICTTTEDDKRLIKVDGQSGAVVKSISIMPEGTSIRSRGNIMKAIDDSKILLYTTSSALILLDALTFETVQTFSIPNIFPLVSNFGNPFLIDGNSLQICHCLMDSHLIVASASMVCPEGVANGGLFLLSWNRLTGEHQSFIKLTVTSPQDYIMAIHKGCVRLVIQNLQPFEVPWNDPNKLLTKGQWLLNVKITDHRMKVIQHSLFESHYDSMGILKFCASGQYLVTGGERYGPLIFEDVNFDSDCDETRFECIFEEEGYFIFSI